MLSTPDFWVFIAFVLFIGTMGYKIFAFLIKALDNHRQKTVHRLEEAQRLQDEALSLLNTYKKKHEEALEHAAKIIRFAEAEALKYKKASESEFEVFLAQKEKALLERITIETEEARAKLLNQITNEALALVEDKLLKDKTVKETLTKASLQEISTLTLAPIDT